MRKMAVLFPGQGTQYVGMGGELYEQYPAAKEIMDCASRVAGRDITKICQGNSEASPEQMQLAVFSVSVAAFRVFTQESGVIPTVLLGHSLGEITALACAGVFPMEQAMEFILLRGRLMGSPELDQGKMKAVMGLAFDKVQKICERVSDNGRIVEVSNHNSKDQLVIAGHTPAVEAAGDFIEQQGGLCMALNTSGPFHCSLMNPICQSLKEVLETYSFGSPAFPVYSATEQDYYTDLSKIPLYLSRQVAKPVCWIESVEHMVEQGIRYFVDIGPQAVLRNLLLADQNHWKIFSYGDLKDRDNFRSFHYFDNPLMNIDCAHRFRFIQHCLAAALCMKNKNRDETYFKREFAKPYQYLEEQSHTFWQKQWEPGSQQLLNAIQFVVRSGEVKKVPPDETRQIVEDLLFESGLWDVFPCKELLHE